MDLTSFPYPSVLYEDIFLILPSLGSPSTFEELCSLAGLTQAKGKALIEEYGRLSENILWTAPIEDIQKGEIHRVDVSTELSEPYWLYGPEDVFEKTKTLMKTTKNVLFQAKDPKKAYSCALYFRKMTGRNHYFYLEIKL